LKQFHAIVALLVAYGATVAAGAPTLAQPMPSHTPTPAPYATSVGAHARYSKARINLSEPNFALTAALVAAGGGAASFDSQKLIDDLTGNGPLTQTEMGNLTKRFGSANVASFVKTFDYVITDALAQAAQAGVELPPTPAPPDGRGLSAALYAAGVPPRGGYDVEYMLDSLVSHVIHVAIMNDIDANPDLGPKADANYHLVLRQTMTDLKTAYNL
jgi:hypothetical protein